ncbi:hypothetical protein EV644_14217 [Kribbella orskensis]|uniref:Uncharacterized protein n=1 Tax=Kribbella orskensis TaxID=2512216 RepID=A0ABY2B766_9ACTN|nr:MULTISPECIES: hypothetical protein [Kribbella]TCN28875.1 hypothetical protein EV642_14517 [Kribbella sp. VKM Ac-2500]TCO08985.1 hypothetical protein EV644_14217 [Kribbella orskensis]
MSSAGLVPVLALAESAGLRDLADEHLVVPTDKGANPELKVASLVAGMAARAAEPSSTELAGVVTALSYGTAGLSVGQRVFGLTDWTRDGTLAEYAAVEARNLAPLPGDVDFTSARASR